MRYKIYFSLVCVLSWVFMSCDTREDIFKEDYNNAIFIVRYPDGSCDTLTRSLGNIRTTFNLYPEQDSRSDRGLDYNVLETEYYSVYRDGRESEPSVSMYEYGVDSMFVEKREGGIEISFTNHSIIICSDDYVSVKTLTGKEGVNRMFDNDTTPALLYSGVLCIPVAGELDDVGDFDYYYAKVNVWGTCPPVPVLDVKDVDGKPMTKTLSLVNSHDRDGNVWRYEYCIDGNVVEYDDRCNHLEFIEGVWQGGNAAFGGTYITATELSEVRHVFQSEGEHTIHYRCMDNNGAWSTWREEKIIVTK